MTTRLNLRLADHPGVPGLKVKMYEDSAAACAHMRDHLLSQPECHAWAVLDSGFGEIVDMDSAKSRWRFAHEAACSPGEDQQELYNLYCDVVSRNLEEASRLGWHVSTGDVTVAVGTGGVLSVIVGANLKTAFLPGQSSPAAVRKSQQQSSSGGTLPREGGCGGRVSQPQRGKNFRVAREREALWTPEERLYYRVFRPAVKFIRRCHCHSGKICDGESGNHYGLLKKCLPSMKALRLNRWIEMRRSTRVVSSIAS